MNADHTRQNRLPKILAMALLAASIAFTILSGRVAGDTSPSAIPGIPAFKLGRPTPGTNQWVNWAWNGDDRRYISAEIQVEGDLTRKTPQQVADWYRKIAHNHPADPMAQFLWAYAAQAESQMVPGQPFAAQQALQCLQGVDPGNMREYARLRYDLTLQMEPNKSHPEIERVGERLLATKSSDWYTRHLMIYDLCNGTNIHKAIHLASAWAASEPKNPKVHATLAFAYQNLWFRDKSRATKALAIGEYQRYIALAPAADPFRKKATYLVGVLQSEKG